MVVGVVQLGGIGVKSLRDPGSPSFCGIAHSAVPSVEPCIAGDDNVHTVVSNQYYSWRSNFITYGESGFDMSTNFTKPSSNALRNSPTAPARVLNRCWLAPGTPLIQSQTLLLKQADQQPFAGSNDNDVPFIDDTHTLSDEHRVMAGIAMVLENGYRHRTTHTNVLSRHRLRNQSACTRGRRRYRGQASAVVLMIVTDIQGGSGGLKTFHISIYPSDPRWINRRLFAPNIFLEHPRQTDGYLDETTNGEPQVCACSVYGILGIVHCLPHPR